VGFTIDDAIALLNGGLADGLSEMTLAGAGRASHIVPTFSPMYLFIIDGIRFSKDR
jgi:hypothetical protein